MTDQFAIVDGTTVNAGGNGVTQDFTDPSITEDVDAAIIILTGATADDSDATHGRMSLGFVEVAGPENRCISWRARSGTSILVGTGAVNTRCGQLFSPTANTTVAECTFNSTQPGGIRLTWNVQPDAQYKIIVILLAGITDDPFVDNTSATSVAANIPPGGAGYRPDGVLFACGGLTFGAPPSTNADGEIGLGGSVDETGPPECCIIQHWDTGTTPTDCDAVVRTDRSGGESLDGTTFSTFQTTAFNATNVTVQGDSVGPSPDFMYLLFKLTDSRRVVRVAIETLPGSTGVVPFTGIGCSPELVIGAANLLTASDSITDGPTAATWGLFAFTRTAQRAACIRYREGVAAASTEASTRVTNGALLVLDHLGAVASRATLDSILPNGFALNFSTATAGRMFVFAIGSPPAQPVVRRLRRIPAARFMRRRQAPPVQGAAAVSMAPRFWEFVTRNRRAAQTRLRRAFLPTVRFTGETVEEEAKLRVFTPGWTRARVTGPGVPSPDIEP